MSIGRGLKERERTDRCGKLKGVDMQSQKTFTVGDLSLRDCWKLLKYSLQYLICLGIIYGIGFALSSGVWRGTESLRVIEPAAGLWSGLPTWSKITLISAILLLILRRFVSDMLVGFGKMFVSLGEVIHKTSFKFRALLIILITVWSVLIIYTPWLGLALAFLFSGLCIGYEEIKKEKLEQMQEEEQGIMRRPRY